MRTIVRLSLAGVFAFGCVAAHAEGDDKGGDRFSRMWDRMCSSQAGTDSRMTEAADRLAQRLSLTEAQKGLLKDLGDTRQKARSDAKTALCAQRPDANVLSKFDFWTKMLDTRLTTMRAVRPKLEAFYNALDDKQKPSFQDAIRQMWMSHHSREASDDRDRERSSGYGRSDRRDDDWSRDDDGDRRRYDRRWGDGYGDRDGMRRDRDDYRGRYGYRGGDDDRGGWRDERDRRDDERDRPSRGRSPWREDDWD